MAAKDLFAPPTKEEIGSNNDLFAPPSEEELKGSVSSSGGLLNDTPVEEPNKIKAAIHGAGDEVLFNYLPEAIAGVKSIFSDKTYQDLKKEEYENQRKLEKENPKSSLGGRAVGLAGALLVPIGGEVKAAQLAGRGLLKAAGKTAAIGAAHGLVRNPGETKDDEISLQLGERGENAIMGGVAGAAGAGLLKGAEKVVKSIPKLKNVADDFFVRAVGARPKFFEEATDQKISDVANYVKKSGMAQVGDSIEEIADKAYNAKDTVGKSLGTLYKSAQQKVDNYIEGTADTNILNKISEATPTIKDLKSQIEPLINKSLKGEAKSGPLRSVMNYLDDLEIDFGDKPLDLLDLHLIKSKVGKEINWNRADFPNRDVAFRELLKNVSGKINTHMEAMDSVLKNTKDAGLAKSLADLNKEFSILSTVSSLSDKAASKSRGLNRLGLTDTITGSGIASGAMASGDSASGGLIKGLIASGISKGVKSYGNPVMANVLSGVSDVANKLPFDKAGNAMGLLNDKISDRSKARLLERIGNKRRSEDAR